MALLMPLDRRPDPQRLQATTLQGARRGMGSGDE
jgi:hypothetical protein